MKFLIIAGLLVAGAVAWKQFLPKPEWLDFAPKEAHFQVTSRVQVEAVTPFGVNLGSWTSWGAEQLSSNVLKNPGFEGIIDRAVVIPEHAAGGSFDDSPAWLARPENFWENASYNVRSGPQAGVSGTVTRSMQRNLFGLPAFLVEDESKLPTPGDVVAVTKESSDNPPTQWWLEGAAGNFLPELSDRRPGSPGKRSLQVTGYAGKPSAVVSYLDAIGARAGKLLPLTGRWELSFWAKAREGAPRLRVVLVRDGSSPVLQQNIDLSSQWSNPHLAFTGTDQGGPGTVSLRFEISGQPAGKVLLDDVDLRRVDDAGFPFRSEVVATLERLHPRYLRDWEGQLGDTLANRIAPPFARKAYRYRPGDLMATDYGYGLRDVLDLCLKVGADPWIIVPTTFSDDECAGLGNYLQSQPDTGRFHELIVEFGNENWNAIFRPAGIPDATLHGQVSDRCLATIRQHAARLPVKLAINAQHANVPAALTFAQQSSQLDMEAVAPYFLTSLARGTPSLEALGSLFAGDDGRLRKIAAGMEELHKSAAVYEVNMHTISGTAPGDERTPIVAGMAAGTALAKTMLDGLSVGIRRQCVYSLSGFDAQLPDNEGFVRIWGITRDLATAGHLRPTGLALELLNRTVTGDMYEIESNGPKKISAYAFRSTRGWAAAVISASNTPQEVEIQFPDTGAHPLPSQLYRLNAKSAGSTNEDSEEVTIAQASVTANGNKVALQLAPWTLAVLLPEGDSK